GLPELKEARSYCLAGEAPGRWRALPHHPQREREVVAGFLVIRLQANGFAEFADGFRQATQRSQCAAQAVVGRGEPRVEGDGPPIVAHGLVEKALLLQRAGQVVVRDGQAGSQPHRLPEMAKRLFGPSFLPERDSEPVVELRVVRLRSERRLEMLDGFVPLALGGQGRAE